MTELEYLYEELFDGWWTVLSSGEHDKNFCYKQSLLQIHAGDPRDINLHRALAPTREQAEEFMYQDSTEGYWKHGLAVYANHCLGCGRWAKVLAFDDQAFWAWRVTECSRCGILDSRV